MTKSRGILRPRHRWTPEQDAQLRELYPHTLCKEIAQQMGLELHQVYKRADRLGLKKAEGFMSSAISGQFQRGERRAPETMFKPGQKPWCAGKKIGTKGRSGETQFKKGQRPSNYKPVGTVRVNGEGYQLIKVSDTGTLWERWKFLHRLTWEKEHGPVPPGHKLVFRNKNRLDCRLENLELVSDAELARRTQGQYPKEIRQLIQLRGAITRAINKRSKQHEKQDSQ